MKKLVIFVLYLFFCSVSVQALEIDTHALLTYKSYQSSIVNQQEFLNTLGITYKNNIFGNIYYDFDDSHIEVRKNNNIEDRIIKSDYIAQPELSLQGWLMRGAIREDDILKDNSGIRVLNHFYDPYFDRPLDYIFELGQKAPNWILGTEDAFTSPLQPLPTSAIKENHYTVFDAMETMYRALTGHDKTGNSYIGPEGIIGDEAVRNAYWATTFRALGDFVHIIQDMSQPQHTRNDIHAPWETEQRKAYEAYTDARAKSEKFKCAPDDDLLTPTITIPVPGLKFNLANGNPYPIPNFTKYSDFFSTHRGSQVVNRIKGSDSLIFKF